MRHSYKIAFLFLFLVVNTVTSQDKLKGNRQVVSENRAISDFTKIEIIDNLTVFLVSNEKQSVTIEADSNLQNAILTEVKNETLTIRINELIGRHKSLTVHLNVSKNLQEISAYNDAEIISKNVLNIDNLLVYAFDNSTFDLKLNSKSIQLQGKRTSKLHFKILSDVVTTILEESSSLTATINAKKMYITGSSKAIFTLAGTSDLLELDASGNTSFKGKDFELITALVKVTNSARIYINVTENIEISANNSSEIHLYSNPKITIQEFHDKSLLRKRESN